MPDFIFRPAALLGLALAAASLGSGARADAAETAPLILPPPDLAKLQLEDGKRSGGPYRYGIQVPSEMPALGPGSDAGGTWSSAKHGRLRWSRRIASPGARSLDFHFSRLQLPTGAELHIVGDGEGNARVIRAEQLDGN